MKYIILTLIVLIFGCKNEPEPCKCDLLEEKEKYFIKSGKLVETNSNKKALEEGKEIEVEVTVSGDPSDLIKKLGKIDANGKIRVPLIDFDKYEYVYQMNMNENSYDRNMLMYFLTYCSSYSSFHKKSENCEPRQDWQSKVDELRGLYLKPENPNKIEKVEIPDRKKYPQEPKKADITISGRIMNQDKADKVKIYLGNVEIGISKSNGSFTVIIKGNINESILLRFESNKCGLEDKSIFINNESVSNIPITLPCK